MRSALILLALIAAGACSDPTESGPVTPAFEPPNQLSRTFYLGAEDLMLPSRCDRVRAPILITFGDFKSSPQPWLINSPQQLGAREL